MRRKVVIGGICAVVFAALMLTASQMGPSIWRTLLFVLGGLVIFVVYNTFFARPYR